MFYNFFQPDYQIITVGWKDGAKYPLPTLNKYQHAISNSRTLGALVAQLLTVIHEQKNYPMSRVHCIGHSLGAHACGFGGRRLKDDSLNMTIGRITGEPYIFLYTE